MHYNSFIVLFLQCLFKVFKRYIYYYQTTIMETAPSAPTGQPTTTTPTEVTYICGGNLISWWELGCGREVTIKPKQSLRCTNCGFRIFYKKRTRTPMQFEAR